MKSLKPVFSINSLYKNLVSYIKMPKDSSAKYYKKIKVRFQKNKACKNQDLSDEEKEKSIYMVATI